MVTSCSWWHYAHDDIMLMMTSCSWWHHARGDTMLVVTSCSWWHHAHGDIMLMVTLCSWWHHAHGDIMLMVTSCSWWHHGIQNVERYWTWLQSHIIVCQIICFECRLAVNLTWMLRGSALSRDYGSRLSLNNYILIWNGSWDFTELIKNFFPNLLVSSCIWIVLTSHPFPTQHQQN